MIKYLIIFLNLILLEANAQTTSYKFRIRYSNYSALSNSKFLINGQQLTTDPQGIINLSIPNQITFANIGSSNPKQYIIEYPMEGRANLPKDNLVFVDIYVSKPGPDPVKIVMREMTRIKAGSDAVLIKKLQEESRRGYDSIVSLLSSRVKIDDKLLAKGRMEFLPLISSALYQYLNEARDANDAFSSLKRDPENGAAVQQFTEAILSYNEIFELLNSNKSTYEQAINTYWKSKELSLKFSSLLDYSIEEIHKPYLLEINYTFFDRINEYSKESSKSRKRDLGKALEMDISQHSAALGRKLNSLGERIASFTTLLTNTDLVEN
ncbi:hypothetical protein [Daejeonella oryzae]|uniref:hypothetical protein n=1 Tax=Daejeonella oryzae TaxID=1122943 RepID=UPI0004262AB6|nr:hypothetical protein [Daejeonella oryzae]